MMLPMAGRLSPTSWISLVTLLAAATAVVTYPQITHMSSGVHDFGDPLLNAWALAWTPHALVTQPASLFDANIFYPEPATLALSESLVFPALLAAPFRAAGANAIFLHNLTLLSACVLSGLTMFLLVRSLTNDSRAAVLAAVAFTVSPLRIEHYPRVQQQLTYLMPLALYAMHRMLDGDTRKRTVILAGAACGLLFYSCVYYLAFFFTLLPLIAALSMALQRGVSRQVAGRLGLAVAIAALLIAPGVSPYLHNRTSVGERQIEELRPGSAELRDYRRATPASWLYADGRTLGPAERHLFTGYVLPVAAIGAIASPIGRWVPYAAALIASIDLSLGINGHSYQWLYEHAFPYRALRVPARFAVLTNMLLAVLAGLGCAPLLRRLPSDAWRNAVLVALVAGVFMESLNRPLPLRDMPTPIPAVYKWLRDQPPGPVVEYPVGNLEGRSGPQDATYEYYSTVHWHPLLNGYSGFAPPSYTALLNGLLDFPSANAIVYLRQRGAKYLLVHEGFYLHGGFAADIQALAQMESVEKLGAFSDPVLGLTFVYRLRP